MRKGCGRSEALSDGRPRIRTYAAMLLERGHRSMDAWYFMFSICFFNASLSMVASTLGSMVTAAPPLSQSGTEWRVRLSAGKSIGRRAVPRYRVLPVTRVRLSFIGVQKEEV